MVGWAIKDLRLFFAQFYGLNLWTSKGNLGLFTNSEPKLNLIIYYNLDSVPKHLNMTFGIGKASNSGVKI